ncbi:zincin-like metallopeptidase domain-containing protein (plasmid) [Bacteroides salyersiae]|nr:zincin-like metallopeptidase domain-containing protein [Bacteroides salyersiae]
MGHSTGHPTRLNRDLAHPFGSEEYGKEELTAEFAAALAGMFFGIAEHIRTENAGLSEKLDKGDPGRTQVHFKRTGRRYENCQDDSRETEYLRRKRGNGSR